MAKLNTKPETLRTHEGGVAKHINPEQQLRRTVLACMLWENTFYEDGESIAERISNTANQVNTDTLFNIAVEAREKSKLRHVPLLLARLMANNSKHKHRTAELLTRIIQRPDEITEFLAIYWKDKRQPLSNQAKKGLAKAFEKFNEYQFAKYDRDGKIKLKDALRLCHPKPHNEERKNLYKKILERTLTTPDTWEVALSTGKGKKETWERLITENKLGGLALLRNLRNMQASGVSDDIIKHGLDSMDATRVLPFRFLSAAKYAPKFEVELESAMFRSLSNQEKLVGKTIIIVDVSGSMHGQLSSKTELSRLDAAKAMTILFREASNEVNIYCTAGNDGTMIHKTELIPSRHGFALGEKIHESFNKLGGGGIFLKQVMDYTYEKENNADRVIVITDEQDCDRKCNPSTAHAYGKRNYLINISSEKNGIGYGINWLNITGFSESIVNYIIEYEKSLLENN